MSENIDTSKLDAATLAKHLGNPEGVIGQAVIAALNKSNQGVYSAALEKLGIKAGECVLEIGFGNGREIPRILSQAADVVYFGLDVSETMITDAQTFNADAVRAGRVTLMHGLSSAIPIDAMKFDKAFALNTMYFWQDPIIDLCEIKRVLRVGGRFVLGMLAPWSAQERPVFEHGFRFYKESELEHFLKQAGFAQISIDAVNETVVPPSGQLWKKDYFIVCAE